ncbi:hypothetical protein LINPERHAP2_LOCUS14985, partial [Linum perenne]
GPWRQVWGIQAPPKIKNLLWRLAREVLPNRSALRNRHVDVSANYGLCDADSESNKHLFLDCVFAQDCWRLTEMFGVVEDARRVTGTFREWIFEVLQKIASTAWSATRIALEGLQDWERAQLKTTHQNPVQVSRGCGRWHAPPIGVLKCNSDISLSSSFNAMGMGRSFETEPERSWGFVHGTVLVSGCHVKERRLH